MSASRRKRPSCGLSCRETLGGQLKIVAEFPEVEVAITNFSNVDKDKDLQD